MGKNCAPPNANLLFGIGVINEITKLFIYIAEREIKGLS
jgi:hypothetical protein